MSVDYPSKNRSNLKRYLFATILPIIFLSLSLSIFLYSQIQLYTFTKAEIEGVRMIRLMYDALTDLQKIRGYSQIYQWKQSDEINNQLKQLKHQFLGRFQQQTWRRETETFHLLSEADHLKTRAMELFTIDPSRARKKQLFARYSELITEILQFMQLAADHSSLILDPELDTYYLIDVLDIQIPYLAESVGRVRGIGSGLLAKKIITREEKELLHNFQAAIQSRIESIQNAQNVIVKTSSNLKTSLHLLPKDLITAIQVLGDKCFLIEDPKKSEGMRPEDFFQLATTAIDLLSTPYQTGILLLTSKLKTRQTKHLWQCSLIFIGTGIAIFLLLFFNRSFYLYNQRLHREMERLSVTDQLTNLYNRRHFYTVFPRELRNTLRHGGQLYLGLLDVDNFKLYNDTYGHPEGDRVLKGMAATMKKVLQRSGDYCFRIGGEEFCFLFNEVDPERAKEFVERIRLAIEHLGIVHQGNEPYGVITASFGIIKVPSDPDCALEQVMSTVDQALYMAKKKGRNQCIFPD